jgi:RNA polymerase sigma factor (sigma-70 family)
MLGNAQDAQDALQDALLLAFRNLSQFKGQAQMSTWLMAIVMNSARMYIWRQHSRSMQPFCQLEGEKMLNGEDYFVDSRPDPEEIYGHAELRRKLHSASKRLSPNVRSAFRLVVSNGLSLREAAQTLGVSIGTNKGASLSRSQAGALHAEVVHIPADGQGAEFGFWAAKAGGAGCSAGSLPRGSMRFILSASTKLLCHSPGTPG